MRKQFLYNQFIAVIKEKKESGVAPFDAQEGDVFYKIRKEILENENVDLEKI